MFADLWELGLQNEVIRPGYGRTCTFPDQASKNQRQGKRQAQGPRQDTVQQNTFLFFLILLSTRHELPTNDDLLTNNAGKAG